MNQEHAIKPDVSTRSDEDKVIPWAEGNGLWATLTRVVSELSAADLVTFLVRNPYTYDTARGLALAIGRQPSRIEPVLGRLVAAGFLHVVDLSGLHVYHLSEEPHRRQTLQQYVTWLQEGYHWARLAMGE